MVWFIPLCILAFILVLLLRRPTNGSKTPVGTLRIDRSEADEAPLLFLELSTDPRNIMDKKQIILNVSTESYLSQK